MDAVKVGDLVTRKKDNLSSVIPITVGKGYKVIKFEHGDATVIDDDGNEYGFSTVFIPSRWTLFPTTNEACLHLLKE